jgi:beta-lactamase regulating signal transducer with metallopeptidase domain
VTASLMTWLWQGGAIAIGVSLALRYAPPRNAATRHLVWCAALLAVVWLGWTSSPRSSGESMPATGVDLIYVPSAPDFLISIFLGIWAAVALVSLLRILPAVRGVYAARDRCRPFPVAIECRLPLWTEARQSGRRAALKLCDAVPGATVLGFHQPWIAIPSLLVETLPLDELDQVILHEYAHVQRRDDWSRLLQASIVSAIWVHPAALFVSRALSREREMACDEWVIARTGEPKAYARCLAHAAEARLRMKSAQRSLVPALLGNHSDLLRRVDRVLGLHDGGSQRVSVVALASAVCVMILASSQMQGVQLAEMAAIVFPIDRVRHIDATRLLGLAAPEYDLKVDAPIQSVTPRATHVPVTPVVLAARVAHVEVITPAGSAPVSGAIAPMPNARAIAGIYGPPEVTAFAPSREPARWNAITEPGREIASAATKTGKRVAAGVTRAGVSLARSF